MRKTAAIFGAVALMFLLGCGRALPARPIFPEPDEIGTGMKKTVLYYVDENEMLVPITRRLPWNESIGLAALNLLRQGEATDAQNPTTLRPPLPNGAAFSLFVGEDGAARVNIAGFGTYASLKAEENAVAAVVNTLVALPGVRSVQVLIDGQEGVTLPFGTDLSVPFTNWDLNVETLAPVEGASKIVLYFPAVSGLYVPVTRFLFFPADEYTAVLELIKGPANAGLVGCLPQDTQIRTVDVEGGVCTVDLSQEFATSFEMPAWEQAAIDTLSLTLRQFAGVQSVRILVEGQEYQPAAAAMAPLYVNEP